MELFQNGLSLAQMTPAMSTTIALRQLFKSHILQLEKGDQLDLFSISSASIPAYAYSLAVSTLVILRYLSRTTKMTNVAVVIYNSTEEDDEPYRWALLAETVQKKSNYMVTLQAGKDNDGYRIENPMYTTPEKSSLLKATIFHGTITADKHDEVVSRIQQKLINRIDETWNCQTWVMEGLVRLEKLGWLQIRPGIREKLQSERENRQ